MNNSIKKIKIYTKDLEKVQNIKKEIENKLISNNFIIDDNTYDLALSIGGDGTFLKMIHENNFNSNIYYASINAGSLGFLTSISIDEIDDFIYALKNDLYYKKEIPLIETTITADSLIKLYSINEFTIRKSDFSTIKINIYINDQLLNFYTGDGIVLCTSNGSTGYNLSLGGPIYDCDIMALLLTPIAPINNNIFNSLTNSLMVSFNKEINFIPTDNNICFINDGQMVVSNNVKKISCKFATKKIKNIFLTKRNQFSKINSKIINK